MADHYHANQESRDGVRHYETSKGEWEIWRKGGNSVNNDEPGFEL